MQDQTYIYILLSRTGTSVARCIRLFTRMPYSHASIALDLSLEEVYSFCRTYRRFPLPATFNREEVGKGVFGAFLTIPCEIYALALTPQEKRELLRRLEYFKQHRSRYSYNLLGLCTTFFHIRWTRQHKLHCSEFVARLLEATGIPLEKPPSLYTPDDLRSLPQMRLVYRGELNQFYQMQRHKQAAASDVPLGTLPAHVLK